jgi:hypothetical protein
MTSSAERDAAVALYEIYQRAFEVLCEADIALSKASRTPWLKDLASAHDELSFAILPRMLRYRIIGKYPEIDTDQPEGPQDTLLDDEEQAAVDRLTANQVQRIDDALLSDCISSGRKVARIAGTAVGLLHDELPDVPTGFYSQRVQALVAAGHLDLRGNLDYMRFSEVRLVRDPLAEVVDAPITVDAVVLDNLAIYRASAKRTDLLEAEPDDPAVHMSANLNRLAERLLHGIAASPSKLWALSQFKQSLVTVAQVDKKGRQRFGGELQRLSDSLGIVDDDGVSADYLGWC